MIELTKAPEKSKKKQCVASVCLISMIVVLEMWCMTLFVKNAVIITWELCRSFKERYLEHRCSIRNLDNKSAHVGFCECDITKAEFDEKFWNVRKARGIVIVYDI